MGDESESQPCPYCEGTAEVEQDLGPITIWECDGDPADVFTLVDDAEMVDIAAEEGVEVERFEVESEDDLNLGNLIGASSGP